MHGRRSRFLLALLLVNMAALVSAQSPVPVPNPALAPPAARLRPLPPLLPLLPGPNAPRYSLPQLASAAGTIFSGTVTAIAPRPATSERPIETVAITFDVENAIRGVTPGQNFTISQWIGVWSAGQRYRVGDRLVLFLYPPSKLGLSSCVAGALGRFALDSSGRVVFSAQQLSTFRTDPIVGGRSRVRLSDFASAVRDAGSRQ